MSFNFAPTANQSPAIALIPAGTSVLTVVGVKEVKRSSNSGGMMAQLEFVIARGPYERRKVWMYIGDPNDTNNSEKWRQMSIANLQHMLESAGIFNHADPTTYARYATVPPEHAFTTILQDLEGKHVAAKLKVEKGTDGNDDRNVISMILSPNPNGRTAKAYADVQAGVDQQAPAPAAVATTGFGTTAAAPVATVGGFTAAAAPAVNTQAGFATANSGESATGAAAPSWLAGQ